MCCVRGAVATRVNAATRLRTCQIHRTAQDDLVLMTPADRKGGLLRVKQSKTDAEMHFPEHRELRAELARGNSETHESAHHIHRVRRLMEPSLARGLLKH